MADLLSLSHEVECAMLDKLQNVGHAIWTMEVDVALFLADEGFVAHGLEQLPGTDEVLYHADV